MNASDPVIKLPPHSIQAEQSLIGGLLLDNSALDRIGDVVAEADFYLDAHRRIFGHIRRLLDAGHPADVVTVSESIEKSNEVDQVGGLAYLGEIANSTPSAANIRRYAEIVREKAAARKTIDLANELAAAAHGRDLGEALPFLMGKIEAVGKSLAGPSQRFKLLSATDLAELPAEPSLVEGVLPKNGVAAIVGASMAGKGFLLTDLMAVIEEGGMWFDRATERAPVTYLCLEGAGGLPKRFRAWEIHNGRSFPRIAVSTDALDLRKWNQVSALIAAIRNAGRTDGVVAIDTLAQGTPGMDENSSQDFGIVISNLQRLQAELGGLILILHHFGKSGPNRGPRGHSSFISALDACIEVRRDGERRSWSIAKAKDDADGVEHEFRLRVIDLDDGTGRTSCVIEKETTANTVVRRAIPPKSGNQAVVWNALGELFRKAGDTRPHGAPASLPAGRPCLEIETAVAQTRTRLVCDPKRQTERTQAAITGLIGRGLLESRDGFIWVK